METEQDGVVKVVSTRPIPDIANYEIEKFPRERQKPKLYKICPKCNEQIETKLFFNFV